MEVSDGFSTRLSGKPPLGSVSAETSTLCNLGVASAASGNLLAAGGFYSQSLSLAQEASDQRSIANILETVAAFLIEYSPRSMAAACRMLGTAENLRDDSDSPRSSSEQDTYDSALSKIRSQLSEHTVSEAWAEGRGTPTPQAIADALQQTEAARADLEPPR